MKYIFILDDNRFILKRLQTALQSSSSNRIQAIPTGNLFQANERLTYYKSLKSTPEHSDDEIVTFLLSSNLNPSGLTTQQISETNGALLTGWIWAYYNVLPKYPNAKILFYTYYSDLIESDEKYRSLIKKNADQIRVVNKSIPVSVLTQQMLEWVGL